MSTFRALASLVAASAFASHHNAELHRHSDKAAAPANTAKKPARQ